MANIDTNSSSASSGSNTKDMPLKSIIQTTLTEALVFDIFNSQKSDGAFPPTNQFDKLFNVKFENVKNDLKSKGLDASISNDIYNLITTSSILFYFLHLSQKVKFPADIDTINELVSKARGELESLPLIEDPTMKTFVDKGELAVKYVLNQREKYANVCKNLNLPQPTWEAYIQHLMGLDN